MTHQRILTMYEELDMTVEQIASEEELDLELVKEYLASNSLVYRSKLKKGEEEITDAEYKQYLEQYKCLGLNSENEVVKEKILWKLIEEKKGRNEARIKALENRSSANINLLSGSVNLIVLQQALKAAQEAKKLVLEDKKKEAIEV